MLNFRMNFELIVCYCCGRRFSSIHIHHINGNHHDDRKENRVKVCRDCHSAIHSWIKVNKSHHSFGKRIRKYYLDSDKEVIDKIDGLRKFLLEERYGKDIRNKKRDKSVKKKPIIF